MFKIKFRGNPIIMYQYIHISELLIYLELKIKSSFLRTMQKPLTLQLYHRYIYKNRTQQLSFFVQKHCKTLQLS